MILASSDPYGTRWTVEVSVCTVFIAGEFTECGGDFDARGGPAGPGGWCQQPTYSFACQTEREQCRRKG